MRLLSIATPRGLFPAIGRVVTSVLFSLACMIVSAS
jgi:hypothetical protein